MQELNKKAPKDFSPAKKKKHEKCVMDVKDQGHDVGSAHAICTSSMKKTAYDDESMYIKHKGEWKRVKAVKDDGRDLSEGGGNFYHLEGEAHPVHQSEVQGAAYGAMLNGKMKGPSSMTKSLEEKLDLIKSTIEYMSKRDNSEVLVKNSLGQWSIEPLAKMDDSEWDAKIRAAMEKEIARRGVTGKDIADHYRDVDESIPAKQRSNIKSSLKAQQAKQNKPKLSIAKAEEPHEDDPNHEKKEKKAAKDIKDKAQAILDLHKE